METVGQSPFPGIPPVKPVVVYLLNNKMPNNFKKSFSLIVIGIFFFSFLISLNFAFAQDSPSLLNNLKNAGEAAQYDISKEGKQTVFAFSGLVGQIIGVFLSILGVIFLILMLYGGYIWMTAHGKSERVDLARTLIRDAIIGIIIVIGSYAVAWFVLEGLAGFNENLQGFE